MSKTSKALELAIDAMQTCDLETETWSVVGIALAIHACKEALADINNKTEYLQELSYQAGFKAGREFEISVINEKIKNALLEAIEALNDANLKSMSGNEYNCTIESCKAALEEQSLTRDWKETILERINKDDEFKEALAEQLSGNSEPLQQVTFVPLSGDEIKIIWDSTEYKYYEHRFYKFARAIEKAHKIGE